MQKMRIHRRVVLGLFSAMLSLDISAQNIQPEHTSAWSRQGHQR